MRSLLVSPLLAALACLAGCIGVSPCGVTVASEPPGARVHVNGRDSGWVTPCQIALDAQETQVVTIALDGFAPRELVLEPLRRHGIVAWRQGVNGVKSTIRFPLLLPTGDLLLPFRESQALAPGRVFVRLRPADAP
jgi:hypothetical protein